MIGDITETKTSGFYKDISSLNPNIFNDTTVRFSCNEECKMSVECRFQEELLFYNEMLNINFPTASFPL